MKQLVDFLKEGPPSSEGWTDDALFETFLEWVMELGIELYPAQEEAVMEIMSGKHVILNTPTGSGKSLVAVAMHFRAICRKERCYYTSPIKALVSEKFFDLCRSLGPEHVGMMTGDASINRDAPIVCCTAEVLANIGVCDGEDAKVDYVIMDEFHYYADRERGIAWQLPLLTLPHATFLLMSATLGDTRRFEQEIPEFTGRELAVVRGTVRPVPLEFEYVESGVHETIEKLVQKDRAPVYVVNFTQRDCAQMAQDLTSMKLIEKGQREEILKALHGFRFDSEYGKDTQRFLKAGIGIHHAGLLPKYRLLVERLAQSGLLKVIVGTDTLGVGVNVPIRSVLFTKLCKFDGEGTKILANRDFKQIAGRAGRKGHDDHGWVYCQAPAHVIENKKLEAKAKSSGKKKFVRKKPPERGYVPWDEQRFLKLVEGEPEELHSSFRVDHGLMINLLKRPDASALRGGGYGELIRLIGRSHERPAIQRRHRRTSAELFRALVQAELVELRGQGKGRKVKVADDLQEDFSMFHTLSLYLVDALELLDEKAEDYALRVLTLAESILESPRAILDAQARTLRNEKFSELKAEGVEYEQRQEELEKVTYPKPDEEFLYDSFNAFAKRHPWVGVHNVRPKSIARDMYESFSSFNGYIKQYGLARGEGVLLRYVNQCYKALDQMVPEIYKDERVQDIIAWLRAMIERVDSSLVQEWEDMLHPPEDLAEAFADVLGTAPEPVDISSNRKAFFAQIRAQLHRLNQALAERDYAEALLHMQPVQPGEGSWDEKALEEQMLPYYEEYERVIFDHRSRMPDKTLIKEREPKLWELRHTLMDPQEDQLWYLEALVDLRANSAPEGPLLQLQRVRA